MFTVPRGTLHLECAAGSRSEGVTNAPAVGIAPIFEFLRYGIFRNLTLVFGLLDPAVKNGAQAASPSIFGVRTRRFP